MDIIVLEGVEGRKDGRTEGRKEVVLFYRIHNTEYTPDTLYGLYTYQK